MDAELKGHRVNILIDAKYHKAKINVNHIDSVFALAKAVGAVKAIIVCSNGWTTPAESKAKSTGMDLRLWPAEDGAKFMNPDFWMFCHICGNGLIIMDCSSFSIPENRLISWWLAGQCKKCRGGIMWCQDCGQQIAAPYGKTQWCYCGHTWRFGKKGLSVYPKK